MIFKRNKFERNNFKRFSLFFISFIACFLFFSQNSLALVSFDKVFDEILSESAELKIYKAQQEAVELESRFSSLTYLPTLSAINYWNSYGNPTYSSESWSLNSQWNLLKFGADWYSIEALNSKSVAARSTFEINLMELESQILETLLNYILVQKENNILSIIHRTRIEVHDIAILRFKKGLLSQQEVDKDFIDLNNSEARLKESEIKKISVKEKLVLLVPRSAESDHNFDYKQDHEFEMEVEWPWISKLKKIISEEKGGRFDSKGHLEFKSKSDFDSNASSTSSSNVNSSLNKNLKVENHPKYLEQKAQIESLENSILASKASFAPKLDLNLSYGPARDYGIRDTNQWTAQLMIELNFFDQWRGKKELDIKKQNLIIEQNKLLLLTRDLNEKNHMAFFKFKTELESALSKEKTSAISKRLYQDSLARFRLGRASVNDLLVDQDRLSQSELFNIEGWKSAHKSFIDYCHIKGIKIKSCLNSL